MLANKRTFKSQFFLLAFSKSFFALDRLEGTRIEAAEGSDVVISLRVAEEGAPEPGVRVNTSMERDWGISTLLRMPKA